MNCHICSQPAVGQCRVCWKFYCPAHGDRACQACQEPPTASQGGRDQARMVLLEHSSEPRDAARLRRLRLDRSIPKQVIGVIRSSKHGEREITLVSLELYDEGFLANFRSQGEERGSQPLILGPRSLPRFSAQATDDQGNTYESMQRGGGGSDGHWNSTCEFTPAPATEARTVHITIDEIQWIGPGDGGTRMAFEPGPWEFDVSLENQR